MRTLLVISLFFINCCTASAQDSTRVVREMILSACDYLLNNPVVTSEDAAKALTNDGFIDAGIDSDVWLWQHPKLPEHSRLDLESFWKKHEHGEEMEGPEYFWELEFRGIALEIVGGEEYVGSCMFVLPASYLADIIFIAQEADYIIGNTRSSRCDFLKKHSLRPAMFRIVMNNEKKRVQLHFWIIENFILIKQLLL